MKKKTWIVALVVLVLIIALGTVASFGIFRSFDARGYVEAILDQTMKGEVEEALKMTDGTTELALLMQYEEGITSFVQENIISGVEVGEELEEKYKETCKKVFADMKYEVQDVEKISKNEYRVLVTYQASDVFAKFIASTTTEATRLKEKVEDGEYRGTVEEINAQMQKDFLENSYAYFQEAYDTMEYGEEKTMVIKVTKGENGLYELNEAEITQFLVKILGLDEIQD